MSFFLLLQQLMTLWHMKDFYCKIQRFLLTIRILLMLIAYNPKEYKIIYTIHLYTLSYVGVVIAHSQGQGDPEMNSKNWLHVCVIALLAFSSVLAFSFPAASAEGGYAFVTKWGSQGTGDRQFDWPHGVAVDSSGNVFVADSWNNRIQKFDSGVSTT